MNNLLLVPIYIDALCLKDGTSVAETMVEFNRLPYFNGKRDVNSDIVNLSESIVTQPFQNKNLFLKPGIHLHWALPDALTQESNDGEFPAVPNRWLITRRIGETMEQWIVESDYLYPISAGFQEDSITCPYSDLDNPNLPLFRYMGRKLTLTEWKEKQNSKNQYLPRLTTVGYGEPAFAAFYPNCRSVFGFHDPDIAVEQLTQVEYDIIGWYSESKSEQNYLSEFLEDFKTNFIEDFPEEKPTPEDFINAIEEELKWQLQSNDEDWKQEENSEEKRKKFIKALKNELNWQDSNFFEQGKSPQIICYSRLKFAPSEHSFSDRAKIELAVANTGTEALSAYLAETLDKSQNKSQKAIIEEQLQALQFAENLENQQLDIGAKFQEIRHQAGFNAVGSGYLWKIRLETQQNNSENQSSQTKLDLPSNIANLLNNLNQKQQEYDAEFAKIDSMQKQLFSDWYKYMVCTYPPEDSWDDYPDIDEVKFYLENKVISPLNEKLAQIQIDDADLETEINILNNALTSYNQQLQNKYDNLKQEEKEKTSKPPIYKLEIVTSPRYWQPKEPVVLMVGDDVKASKRHGQDGINNQDGLLECQIITNKTIQDLISENFQTVFEKINELEPKDKEETIGFSTWTKQPWNPFLLQWLVELFSVEIKNNTTAITHNYSNNFLTKNYTLLTEDIDLSPKEDKLSITPYTGTNRIKTDQDSNIYSGFSILTPYANSLLQKRIDEYLEKYSDGDQGNENFTNPLYTAKKAKEELEKLNCLSQSLGGFNDALLMHKQTLQLAIEDPIGFEDYQRFTREVARLVDDKISSAPQPLDDFTPIRTGEMRIIDLELIDTFGQVRNLDWDEYVIKPESMKAKQDNRIILPPRFVQPCRINFRWRSANVQDSRETNDDPKTTPICGWIVPNNLNNSLMIYDNTGQALGSININGEWDDAPGNNPLETITITIKIEDKEEDIKIPNISKINIHLHKMVKTIMTLGRDFVKNFNLCLNNALNNINPENFAQNQSMALLMGRPIAVVRASVNLELQGLPAINQDWHVFRQEIQQMKPLEERDTDDLVDVKIPIRIGEYRQLNDGVIGYWKEKIVDGQDYEYENNIFYAQQSDLNESEKIETQFIDPEKNPEVEEGPINLIQSINSPAQTLTMLVDPRGVFHATSGILPSKVINIPPEHYTEALANIKVTFLTSPILTDETNQGSLNLPLPTAPDYDWVWLEKKGRENWSEILTTPAIEKTAFIQSYSENKLEENPEAEIVWQELLNQGWLIAFNDNENDQSQHKTKIVSKDDRKTLTGDLENLDNLINKIFDLNEISLNSVSSQANFSGTQEIREGWLVLSKP